MIRGRLVVVVREVIQIIIGDISPETHEARRRKGDGWSRHGGRIA